MRMPKIFLIFEKLKAFWPRKLNFGLQKIGACGAEKVGLEMALESCTLGGGGPGWGFGLLAGFPGLAGWTPPLG